MKFNNKEDIQLKTYGSKVFSFLYIIILLSAETSIFAEDNNLDKTKLGIDPEKTYYFIRESQTLYSNVYQEYNLSYIVNPLNDTIYYDNDFKSEIIYVNVTYQGVTQTLKSPLTWFGQNFIFPDWTYWSTWVMNNMSEFIKPNYEVLIYETEIIFEVTQQIHPSLNKLQYFLDNFVLFEFSNEFWSREFGDVVDTVKTVYEKETGVIILENELKFATFKNGSYYALFNDTYYDPSRLHLLKSIDNNNKIEFGFPGIVIISFSLFAILIFVIILMKREWKKR